MKNSLLKKLLIFFLIYFRTISAFSQSCTYWYDESHYWFIRENGVQFLSVLDDVPAVTN